MGSLVLNTAEFTCAFGGTEAQDWSEEKQTELFAGHGTFPGGGEKQPEEQVLVCVLQDVHDGVVELGEHHEVHGQAGAAVLRGRVTREPGQGVVLLQHKPQDI